LCPFREGAELGPHLTQCGLGRGQPQYQLGILIHPAVWPQQTWAKNWGRLCPFGGDGSPSNTMWPGLRPTSAPSGILIHPLQSFGPNRHEPKIRGLCPIGEGAGSPSNTMWPGPRSTFIPSGILIHPAVWPQQTWAKNRRGYCAPFFEGRARSPSNTMWPGPWPISIPIGILIHPAI